MNLTDDPVRQLDSPTRLTLIRSEFRDRKFVIVTGRFLRLDNANLIAMMETRRPRSSRPSKPEPGALDDRIVRGMIDHEHRNARRPSFEFLGDHAFVHVRFTVDIRRFAR